MNGVMSSVRCGAVLAALLAVPDAGVAVAQVSVDAFASVPANEIAGQQIGWFVNRSFDAFVAAVEQQKPLILVFGELKSNLTQKFAVHVTPCPHLNQLAGIAVFAYGSPVVDERARQMASHLKITDYPTISIIAPRTDKLTEIYRMEGFFDAESIGNDLQRVLIKEGFWPSGVARPAKLPNHVLAYPGRACTWAGAKRLGIVAADAPPP